MKPALTPAAPWRLACLLFAGLAVLLLCALPASAAPVLTVTQAQSVASNADHYPADAAGAVDVSLPDDWGGAQPRADGSVWYRVRFHVGADPVREPLLALYVDRACSALDVDLNGQRVHESPRAPGGRLPRLCQHPQLVSLPVALLRPGANLLDLRVQGLPLPRVAGIEHAAGLSALQIGPQAQLAALHARHEFDSVTAVGVINLALGVIGVLLLIVSRTDKRELTLAYAGLFALGLALLSARVWWRHPAVDPATFEFGVAMAFPVLLALLVQTLLCHANVRSRMLEAALLAQCVVLPLTLLIAGPGRLFFAASGWYLVMAAETIGALALYLRILSREQRRHFRAIAAAASGAGVLLLGEVAVQRGWLPASPVPLLLFLIPLLLCVIGVALLIGFVRSVRVAEAGQQNLEQRVREITVEIERNFAQLAEMRVEQVTEKERKRIAADLHDDLGAKLLTIVHTSESERISTLAREALEEMRLSVRGLTGKPVQLADALADWRAETVLRLGQADIEIDWRSLTEDSEQVLPARAYVQTTRILREAVNNIIKHSGASQVKVRCAINGGQFGLNIQDNGKGIPMELDGKLDRGHGMSSMKHRAKQMQGQCLVESGPGYGTVIRLTLPLGPEVSAAAAR